MNNYEILGQIGKGSFGTVYKCRARLTSMFVAMKVIPLFGKSQQEISVLQTEIELLRSIQHPNIIRLIESFNESGNMCIVTELGESDVSECLNGINSQFINSTAENSNQYIETLRYIARQTLSGLQHLHDEKRIVHRDFKPSNVLIVNGVCKLCDFGFAKRSNPGNATFLSLKGTPVYLAPELARQRPYDFSCDVWSFGVSIFELACGSPPFSAADSVSLLTLLRGPLQVPFTRFDVFQKHPLLKNFIELCLQTDPKQRLSAAQLLNHKFLTGAQSATLKAEAIFAQARDWHGLLQSVYTGNQQETDDSRLSRSNIAAVDDNLHLTFADEYGQNEEIEQEEVNQVLQAVGTKYVVLMTLVDLLRCRKPDIMEELKSKLENTELQETALTYPYFKADYQYIMRQINNPDNLNNLEVQKELFRETCYFCAAFITKYQIQAFTTLLDYIKKTLGLLQDQSNIIIMIVLMRCLSVFLGCCISLDIPKLLNTTIVFPYDILIKYHINSIPSVMEDKIDISPESTQLFQFIKGYNNTKYFTDLIQMLFDIVDRLSKLSNGIAKYNTYVLSIAISCLEAICGIQKCLYHKYIFFLPSNNRIIETQEDVMSGIRRSINYNVDLTAIQSQCIPQYGKNILPEYLHHYNTLDNENGYYFKSIYCDDSDFMLALEVLTIYLQHMIRQLPDLMNYIQEYVFQSLGLKGMMNARFMQIIDDQYSYFLTAMLNVMFLNQPINEDVINQTTSENCKKLFTELYDSSNLDSGFDIIYLRTQLIDLVQYILQAQAVLIPFKIQFRDTVLQLQQHDHHPMVFTSKTIYPSDILRDTFGVIDEVTVFDQIQEQILHKQDLFNQFKPFVIILLSMLPYVRFVDEQLVHSKSNTISKVTSLARHLSGMIGSVISSTISEALISKSLSDEITTSDIAEASTKSINVETSQLQLDSPPQNEASSMNCQLEQNFSFDHNKYDVLIQEQKAFIRNAMHKSIITISYLFSPNIGHLGIYYHQMLDKFPQVSARNAIEQQYQTLYKENQDQGKKTEHNDSSSTSESCITDNSESSSYESSSLGNAIHIQASNSMDHSQLRQAPNEVNQSQYKQKEYELDVIPPKRGHYIIIQAAQAATMSESRFVRSPMQTKFTSQALTKQNVLCLASTYLGNAINISGSSVSIFAGQCMIGGLLYQNLNHHGRYKARSEEILRLLNIHLSVINQNQYGQLTEFLYQGLQNEQSTETDLELIEEFTRQNSYRNAILTILIELTKNKDQVREVLKIKYQLDNNSDLFVSFVGLLIMSIFWIPAMQSEEYKRLMLLSVLIKYDTDQEIQQLLQQDCLTLKKIVSFNVDNLKEYFIMQQFMIRLLIFIKLVTNDVIALNERFDITYDAVNKLDYDIFNINQLIKIQRDQEAKRKLQPKTQKEQNKLGLILENMSSTNNEQQTEVDELTEQNNIEQPMDKNQIIDKFFKYPTYYLSTGSSIVLPLVNQIKEQEIALQIFDKSLQILSQLGKINLFKKKDSIFDQKTFKQLLEQCCIICDCYAVEGFQTNNDEGILDSLLGIINFVLDNDVFTIELIQLVNKVNVLANLQFKNSLLEAWQSCVQQPHHQYQFTDQDMTQLYCHFSGCIQCYQNLNHGINKDETQNEYHEFIQQLDNLQENRSFQTVFYHWERFISVNGWMEYVKMATCITKNFQRQQIPLKYDHNTFQIKEFVKILVYITSSAFFSQYLFLSNQQQADMLYSQVITLLYQFIKAVENPRFVLQYYIECGLISNIACSFYYIQNFQTIIEMFTLLSYLCQCDYEFTSRIFVNQLVNSGMFQIDFFAWLFKDEHITHREFSHIYNQLFQILGQLALIDASFADMLPTLLQIDSVCAIYTYTDNKKLKVSIIRMFINLIKYQGQCKRFAKEFTLIAKQEILDFQKTDINILTITLAYMCQYIEYDYTIAPEIYEQIPTLLEIYQNNSIQHYISVKAYILTLFSFVGIQNEQYFQWLDQIKYHNLLTEFILRYNIYTIQIQPIVKALNNYISHLPKQSLNKILRVIKNWDCEEVQEIQKLLGL